MITVTPQGQIYLCRTPLENDYKNQLTFSNLSDQINFFNSKVIKSFDDYTYIKQDNVIKVNESIDNIIDCNYLFYRNNGFTNKYYFCFITGMEYVSENVTAITFETDVFQTWYFQIQYKKCFVEREHVSSDIVGEHTVYEGLELGDYIQQRVTAEESVGFNFFYDENGHGPRVVVAVSETGLSVALPSGSKIYNGIYGGLIFLTFPTYADCDKYIRYIQSQTTQDIIYACFMLPSSLAEVDEWLTHSGGNFQYGFVKYSSSAKYMKTGTINKPTVLDASYTPKNKKLLTFPYVYFTVSNNSGSVQNYKYEYFTDIDGSRRSNCPFEIYGALGVGGSVKAYPLHYKMGKTALNYNEENYLESLDAGKMPTCSWLNDSYTNWLTSNAVNIGLEVASDVVKVGTGIATGGAGVVSGLSGITGTLAEIYQHSLTPVTAKGGINQGDLLYAKGETFTVTKMSIKQEYAKIIDDYLSMFGYKVNSVKVPNITGRQNWNYVKTIDCNFDGDIPQSALNIIKKMFNNGVTLWHNPDNMLNYNVSNNIV